MKKLVLFIAVFCCCMAANAQHYSSDHTSAGNNLSIGFWFSLMELPFLFLCVYFAFKTSIALKGGVFGKGMGLMAWGFLVMAVGHLHMQIDHFFGYNIFNNILGYVGGNLVWFVALVATWSLSGLGFYSIYKATSKG